jgi:hypothetical protein
MIEILLQTSTTNQVHENKCTVMKGELVQQIQSLPNSATCGMKTAYWRLKPIEAYEESVRHTDLLKLLTSLLTRVIQMEEIFRQGWSD